MTQGLLERGAKAMPVEFEFKGLRCFPSASDPRTYHFLPTRADLRRGPSGQPLTTLVEAGTAGYLMFSAAWEVGASEVEELRHELAARLPSTPAADIRLSFAPVLSVRCHVLIGDGRGTQQTAASSSTSGLPPYDAVFSLFLQGERLDWVQRGLRGEPGYLAVEYRADLRVPVSAAATLDARASELMPWIAERGADDMLRLLEEAVERGLAAVTIEVPDPHGHQLAVGLYERVLARTAQLLRDWLTERVPDRIHVTVRLDEDVTVPVRAFADVGMIVSRASVRAVTGEQDAAD
jgi:hypothetical protein